MTVFEEKSKNARSGRFRRTSRKMGKKGKKVKRKSDTHTRNYSAQTRSPRNQRPKPKPQKSPAGNHPPFPAAGRLSSALTPLRYSRKVSPLTLAQFSPERPSPPQSPCLLLPPFGILLDAQCPPPRTPETPTGSPKAGTSAQEEQPCLFLGSEIPDLL